MYFCTSALRFLHFFPTIVKVYACWSLLAHLVTLVFPKYSASHREIPSANVYGPELTTSDLARAHAAPPKATEMNARDSLMCVFPGYLRCCDALTNRSACSFPESPTFSVFSITLSFCLTVVFPTYPCCLSSLSPFSPLYLILSFSFKIWERIFIKSWWIWQMRKWRLSSWAGTRFWLPCQHALSGSLVSPCQPMSSLRGLVKADPMCAQKTAQGGPYESLQVMCDATSPAFLSPLLPH